MRLAGVGRVTAQVRRSMHGAKVLAAAIHLLPSHTTTVQIVMAGTNAFRVATLTGTSVEMIENTAAVKTLRRFTRQSHTGYAKPHSHRYDSPLLLTKFVSGRQWRLGNACIHAFGMVFCNAGAARMVARVRAVNYCVHHCMDNQAHI